MLPIHAASAGGLAQVDPVHAASPGICSSAHPASPLPVLPARRRSQGIGGSQRVPPLYSLVAPLTAADRDPEAPYPGTAHDLFLIPRLHPLHPQRSSAGRALLGSGYLDRFINVIGKGTLVVGNMRRPRPAARGWDRSWDCRAKGEQPDAWRRVERPPIPCLASHPPAAGSFLARGPSRRAWSPRPTRDADPKRSRIEERTRLGASSELQIGC